MARARELGLGGVEEEAGGAPSGWEEEEEVEEELSAFSVSVPGLLPSETESPPSPSASRSQPESSNTMSKEEEVQSPWQRRGHSSKEWGVSEASGAAWLSCSEARLSSGPRGAPPPAPPPAALADVSPPGPKAAGETELETGTLTDSASRWSGSVSGQSVVLRGRGRVSQ